MGTVEGPDQTSSKPCIDIRLSATALIFSHHNALALRVRALFRRKKCTATKIIFSH